MENKNNNSATDNLQAPPEIQQPAPVPAEPAPPEQPLSPTPPSLISTEQPPSPKERKTGLLFGILFIILLFVGVYFIYTQGYLDKLIPASSNREVSPSGEPTPTPTTDLTADWEIYTNTSYGYTIKFPQTWEVQIVASGAQIGEAPKEASIVDIYDPTNAANPYPYGVITIKYFESIPSHPDDWIITKETVNGNDATKYATENGPDGGPVITYLFNTGEAYFEITFRYGSGDPVLDTFNQILSTFKFTNQ